MIMNSWLPVVIPVLQVASGAAALVFFYAAFALYEDDEQKVQVRLEEFWLQVADQSGKAVRRARNILAVAARLTGRILDRLFGPALISWRAAFAAGGLFGGSLAITSGVAALALPGGLVERLMSMLAVVTGLLLAFISVNPADPSAPKRGCLGALIVIPSMLLIGKAMNSGIPGPFDHIALPLLGALLLGLCNYLLAVIVIRWAVAKCETAGTSVRVLVLLLLVAMAVSTVLGPGVLALKWSPESKVSTFLIAAGAGNVMAGLAVLAFGVVLVLVTIDVMAWPILARTVYPAQRNQIVRNRKLLASLGVLCATGAGVPILSAVGEAILKIAGSLG
jgi:hypothetical protein